MTENENAILSNQSLPDPWNMMLEDIQANRSAEVEDSPLAAEEIERLMALGAETATQPGAEILAQTVQTPDRILSALRPIGERIAATTTRDLRNALAVLVDFSFLDVSYSRLGVLVASIPIPSLMAPLEAESDTPAGLIFVDHSCASLYLDTVLGGGQSLSSSLEAARPYSAIETKLFEGFIAACLTSIGPALLPHYDHVLSRKPIETQPRYLTLGKFTDPIIRFRFRFQIEKRKGIAEIIFTNEVLLKLERALLPARIEQIPQSDEYWRKSLVGIAAEASIDLDLVLAETSFSFRHLQTLKIGDTLNLGITQDTPVHLRAHKKIIGKGMVGRAGSKKAIRMLGPINVTQS